MDIDVTIYSTNNCGYCELMKNFLQEQKIKYKVITIQDNPEIAQFLMQQTGRLGAPQTSINGEWVLGYDPNTAMKIIRKYKNLS